MEKDIRKKLEPLELLDLKKCRSLGTTIGEMKKCAIGARMIGEMAESLTELIKSGKRPAILFDGKIQSPLGKLLKKMVEEKKWFSVLAKPEDFEKINAKPDAPLLIIGGFSERYADLLYSHTGRSFYINNCNLVRPGQIKDGHFPDFLPSDPRFTVPVIARTIEERLENKPVSVVAMLNELESFGGVASQIIDGYKTFRTMINDPDCTIIATFSGIMTVSKMGGLIAEMIDMNIVKAITATGALICHGFVEGVGLKHFKYDPSFSDIEMAEQKLNRITDCVEPEENLDQVEEVLGHILNENISGEKPVSPSEINFLAGEYLKKHHPHGPSILRSAYDKNVPVFIPASVDSELGNDIYITNEIRKKDGKKLIVVDHEIDSRKLVALVLNSKKVGIFSLGGGVPRNNVQNVAPLIEIMGERLGLNYPGRMFSYGVRIDPTLPYLGNLSGCTYSEGGSWRKMDIKNGRFSEVLSDATMVFPLYMAALKEEKNNN